MNVMPCADNVTAPFYGIDNTYHIIVQLAMNRCYRGENIDDIKHGRI